jgi:hypothetical protein
LDTGSTTETVLLFWSAVYTRSCEVGKAQALLTHSDAAAMAYVAVAFFMLFSLF